MKGIRARLPAQQERPDWRQLMMPGCQACLDGDLRPAQYLEAEPAGS